MTATWKTFCHDRGRGWIAELTVTADDAGALWGQVDQALAQLEARGYAPLDPYAAPIAARVAANLAGQLPRDMGGNGGEPDPVCPLHGMKMTRHDGAGGTAWYSHRLADGWCNGTPPRGGKAKPARAGLFDGAGG